MHKELLTAWQCMVCIVVEWPVDHFAVQMFGINARWQQIHHQDRHIPHVGVVQPLWKPACHCCCIFCWGNHFFIILCSPLCLLKWQNCLNSNNIFSESQFTHGMYCFNRSGKGVLSGISSVYWFSYLWIVSHSVWIVLFQFFSELCYLNWTFSTYQWSRWTVLFKLDSQVVQDMDCVI